MSKNIWFVRLGSKREYEDSALKDSLVSISFGMGSFLKQFKGKERCEIKRVVRQESSQNDSGQRIGNVSGQIDRFVNEMQVGDIVICPIKNKQELKIGEIAEGCKQTQHKNGEILLSRKVKWMHENPVYRSDFNSNSRNKFNFRGTLCEIGKATNELEKFEEYKRILQIAISRHNLDDNLIKFSAGELKNGLEIEINIKEDGHNLPHFHIKDSVYFIENCEPRKNKKGKIKRLKSKDEEMLREYHGKYKQDIICIWTQSRPSEKDHSKIICDICKGKEKCKYRNGIYADSKRKKVKE